MKNIPGYLLIIVLLIAFPLSSIVVADYEKVNKLSSISLNDFQLSQYPEPSGIPSETPITSTLVTTATLTLEPFPTVTLIFPELVNSSTPSITFTATKEPAKGIPLPMIASNNPPANKSLVWYGVAFFWVVLIIFAIILARKIYQLWIEER